jgi:hypothetical protein
LEQNDLSLVSVAVLHEALQPAALLERFAARKAHGLAQNHPFLEIKGTKGQLQGDDVAARTYNDNIAFKCLHYSVTEASQHVEVTVVKKVAGQEFEFGIRTVEDTAKESAEFEPINKVV